jgi:(1->4)-alpha-D-glucan 1-alpha-D-glucosylmutase
MVVSLAQTLVKITAPGVPDFYQGTELWDLSLVDPDNRRPVDFALRCRLLEELTARVAAGERATLARELVEHWPDGRIKLYTIARGLACRQAARDLFQDGEYVPLTATGPGADHVVAFARRSGDRIAVTVVPRTTARLTDGGSRLALGKDAWGTTWLRLPADFPGGPYRDVFTGADIAAHSVDGAPALAVGEMLAVFPVALLEAPAAAGPVPAVVPTEEGVLR